MHNVIIIIVTLTHDLDLEVVTHQFVGRWRLSHPHRLDRHGPGRSLWKPKVVTQKIQGYFFLKIIKKEVENPQENLPMLSKDGDQVSPG